MPNRSGSFDMICSTAALTLRFGTHGKGAGCSFCTERSVKTARRRRSRSVRAAPDTPAIESYNAEHEADILILRRKYLNNIVEQDHRAINRVARPALAFKSFNSAVETLAGVELMHMVQKGAVGNYG